MRRVAFSPYAHTLRKAGRWPGELEFCRKDNSRGLMDSHAVALVFDPTDTLAITIGESREGDA